MKRILYIFIFSTLSFSGFSAQEDPFSALLKKLEEFTKKYPQEKVHLHLDKPYYAIGDDIWFKAYVIDSRTSSPTAISNILYIELINEKDTVEKQLKLPMSTGIAWGDFKLADSLIEGNYRIRAYTQWMRNTGPEFFFDKSIKIGNSLANQIATNTSFQFSDDGKTETVKSIIKFIYNGEPYSLNDISYSVELENQTVERGKSKTDENGTISFKFVNEQPNKYKSGYIYATALLPNKEKVTKIIPVKTTSSAIDVQFFPEGSSLVRDLPTRIAVKAVNSTGNGEDIKGAIIDEDGAIITNFETSHLGMGSFSLNPMKNKTYQAKITFKNGDEKLVELPKIEDSGYIMNLNVTDTSKLIAKISISEDLVGKGDLQLLAQKNGKIHFTAKIATSKNFALVNLPRGEFPSGMSTITLFNASSIPVAERLVFINNKTEQIQLEALDLKQTYGKKANLSLGFSAKIDQLPTMGSFSVAVTNESVVAPDEFNETNIFTSLLLKSELKGYIEKPNYYFSNDSLQTQIALDHLLLTQGWRKIDWIALKKDSMPISSFNAETNLQISGTVTTFGGKALANAKITLLSSSPEIFAIDTLTDNNGRFVFKNLNFPDSSKLVLQANNQKGKPNVLIKLDAIPVKQSINQKNIGEIEVNMNETLRSYLKKSEEYFNLLEKNGMLDRTIRLKKVEIKAQKKTIPVTSNLNGAGRADVFVSAKQMENAPDFPNVLIKAGLKIGPDGTPRLLSTPDKPMLIVLDGAQQRNSFTDMNNLNAMDIESVEILKNSSTTSIYGVFGMNGVLVITTKNGSSTPEYQVDKDGIITYSAKGYATSRVFYSPKYDKDPNATQDLRTTVYWNPSILSDKDGKFKLNYFNTDQPGRYRIVIEGIDIAGNLARKAFTYQVN